jgi:hypothetical protein
LLRLTLLCILGIGFIVGQPHGLVSGVVLDAQTGEPLARVRLSLVGAPWQTQSDAQGRFSLTGIPAGQYTLQQLPSDTGWYARCSVWTRGSSRI